MFSSQIHICRFHQAVFKKFHRLQILSNFEFKDSFGILNTRAKVLIQLYYNTFCNLSRYMINYNLFMKYNFSFVYLRNYLKITVLLQRNPSKNLSFREICPSAVLLPSVCHLFANRMLSFYLLSLCHRFFVLDFCNLGISLTRACWAEFPTCSSHWQGFIWQWVR